MLSGQVKVGRLGLFYSIISLFAGQLKILILTGLDGIRTDHRDVLYIEQTYLSWDFEAKARYF